MTFTFQWHQVAGLVDLAAYVSLASIALMLGEQFFSNRRK